MVWIEIIAQGSFVTSYAVTTLRVVWIEIDIQGVLKPDGELVTTLRVVWIEIFFSDIAQLYPSGHHLAGGVD